MIDQQLGRRILDLRSEILANFNKENWQEVGLLTGHSDTINRYPRLLRSLDWGDEDYSGNILGVLQQIADGDMNAFTAFERYVYEKFGNQDTEYVSAKPSDRRITFAPNVFSVPDTTVEPDLVAVMMPINAGFAPVYTAIKSACDMARFRCLRADDIWEDSAIIQDIFNLVFRAQIIVVDFTAKNPNVMYETGIAHTLGKTVIPISQSMDDVPFDLKHHRVLTYLRNGEGLAALTDALHRRIAYISQTQNW
jgi:hypothetical protein